jgi:putative flippase GtrA
MVNRKNSKTKRTGRLKIILFSVIGIFNTLLDIVLYVIILNITHKIVIANVLSTSVALVGSYFLNSRITFQSKKWTKRTFVSFVIVTVFGLWVLQTGSIYVFNELLKSLPAGFWKIFGSFTKTVRQVLPKLMATAITLVWNYLWYNKVIFKGENSDEAKRLALTDL